METKLNIITPADARKLMEQDPARVARLSHFFEAVREEAEQNVDELHYYYDEQLGDFTGAELDYLRSLGYYIAWGSPKLCYEVSWRKE